MDNTVLLEKKIEKMGARVEFFETGESLSDPASLPSFDIRNDKKGEKFFIRMGKNSTASIEVIDLQPKDRHMLVLVRQPDREVEVFQNFRDRLDGKKPEMRKLRASKSKFLLGHDERHWFVAAIPEDSSASNVRTAKEALQPPEVREAIVQKKVKRSKRTKRRNKAFKRQGEWFFVPVSDLVPDEDLILKNEPLSRGRGSKPHMMEFAYRRGGVAVYVNHRHPTGLTQREYEALPAEQQRGSGVMWAKMVRDATVFAKGKISHGDHAPVILNDWHCVLMNTENKAHAIDQVAFLD